MRHGQVDLVPHFILPALGGGTVDRGAYRGRRHLVFVFLHGGRCDICTGLLAALRMLHGAVTREGAEILLVINTQDGESRDHLVSEALPFPVIVDGERLGPRFGLATMGPKEAALFVADRHGEIRLAAMGSPGVDEVGHGLPLEKIVPVLELLQVSCSI